MPTIHLNLDQPAWPDIATKNVIHYTDPIQMSALDAGMESGAPSVAMRYDLPDGRVLIAESSLAVLVAAVRAIAARMDAELCPHIEPTAEIITAALVAIIPPNINVTTATGIAEGKAHSVAVLVADDGQQYQVAHGDSVVVALRGLFDQVTEDIRRHKEEGHEDGGTVH